MAAAIGCPVAASVTHCMMQTREVLSERVLERSATGHHADRHGSPRGICRARSAATPALHSQSNEPIMQRIPLLTFAANPPPIGA